MRDSDSPDEQAEPAVLSTILVPGTVKDEKQQHRLLHCVQLPCVHLQVLAQQTLQLL